MIADHVARVVPESLRALARGLRFSFENAGFKERVIQKQLDDRSFPFLIGDSCGEQWYAQPTAPSPELLFLKSMVRPGDVVLECGTHHGLFTILLGHWVGQDGRVIGFEASPSSAVIASRNIALNELGERVTIESKAVGAAKGTIRVTTESNAVAIQGRSLPGTEVECVPLDEYADRGATLLKLDVEGFELDVLSGARRILDRRPKLAIEVHVELLRRFGRHADEIFDLIPRADYNFWLQREGSEHPRPYAGERLDSLSTPQVHLYALPKAAEIAA